MSSSDVDERASQADGDEEMGLDDDVMEIQEMVGQDGRGKGQGVTARGKVCRGFSFLFGTPCFQTESSRFHTISLSRLHVSIKVHFGRYSGGQS